MTSTGKGRSRGKGPNKRLVNSLRKQLQEERVNLLEQAESLEQDFRDESWKDRRSDDEAEVGSATFERERTASLAQHARAQLKQIEVALESMDDGTYGVCTSCGEPIDLERLEARPQSILCLPCQRSQERFR